MQNKSRAMGTPTVTILGLLVLLGFMLSGIILSNQLVARSPQSNERELGKLESGDAIPNWIYCLARLRLSMITPKK